jgi:threonine/homoserine/homoserine lactone efflux protein
MIPLHNLLIYAGIYAFVIALPGPNVIAIAARALAGGFAAAVPAAFGTALGDIILMTASAFGLEAIAKASGPWFLAVKIAGVAYLIYLGWKYWNAPADHMDVAASNPRKGFLAQLAVTAGNPKGMAFFFALLPTVIDLSRINAIGYLELVAATLILIPAITLTYAALAARARTMLASERARRRINKGAGAIIIGAALGIAVS